jgi:hypothetical protein
MAASVQGWRKKWFYIKDRKIASSDQYGVAPFDANQRLHKLASWDSPPTGAEMEEIKPFLARIQSLKDASGVALSGTQLMAFFLQWRIHPLQHRVAKFWSYSGLEDSSRVSAEDIDKKDLDKRVRALTTLMKDHEIPALTADFFDFEHPLPAVCAFSCITFSFICLLVFYHCFAYSLSTYFPTGSPIHCFSSSSSRGRTYSGCSCLCCVRSPQAEDSQDGDEAEDSLEGTSSTTSPPPALSEDLGLDKKRKCVEELLYSSTSTHKSVAGEASALEDEEELFDLLDL